MEKLQELSLVSKICMELENHLGMSDKTLAEFIIEMVRESATSARFLAAIKENDLPLQPSLAENLYRIVNTMAPRKPSNGKGKATSGGGASARSQGSKKYDIGDDEQLTAKDIAGADIVDDEIDIAKQKQRGGHAIDEYDSLTQDSEEAERQSEGTETEAAMIGIVAEAAARVPDRRITIAATVDVAMGTTGVMIGIILGIRDAEMTATNLDAVAPTETESVTIDEDEAADRVKLSCTVSTMAV
uniref:Uncharacterized protein n=1 Tax=Globisporangium ultimum (strain ATCC 200006 / CBS 805.95 / DAOM BR144) TaxID=431595 RepID=K3WHT0_GLOUD